MDRILDPIVVPLPSHERDRMQWTIDRLLYESDIEKRHQQNLSATKNVILWVRVGITALAAPFVGFIILSRSADPSNKELCIRHRRNHSWILAERDAKMTSGHARGA